MPAPAPQGAEPPAEAPETPSRAAPTEFGPAPPTEDGPRPAPTEAEEPRPGASEAPTELGTVPPPAPPDPPPEPPADEPSTDPEARTDPEGAPQLSLDPVVTVPPPPEAVVADPLPPFADESPPLEPPAPDLAALLDASVARLDARLETVETRVAELARLGGRDRDLVDRLHADNQTLRAGELDQAQAPLLRDLIRLHDDLERLGSAAADGGDLGIVHSQLVAVLARAGVDRFTPADGEPFDAAQHQGRGTVPTDDPAKARRIARVARAGFRRGGKTIRAAEVEVFAPAPHGSGEPDESEA